MRRVTDFIINSTLSNGHGRRVLAPRLRAGPGRGPREGSEDAGSGTEHPHWLQLTQGCRPFSLQEVHLRALKESVKQLRNTDILLPWHMGHGMKAKPPQVWHVWGCCTLWRNEDTY